MINSALQLLVLQAQLRVTTSVEQLQLVYQAESGASLLTLNLFTTSTARTEDATKVKVTVHKMVLYTSAEMDNGMEMPLASLQNVVILEKFTAVQIKCVTNRESLYLLRLRRRQAVHSRMAQLFAITLTRAA